MSGENPEYFGIIARLRPDYIILKIRTWQAGLLPDYSQTKLKYGRQDYNRATDRLY